MNTSISTIAASTFDGAITFTPKKGAMQTISIEGCIIAGGAKLAALKNEVWVLAVAKALTGKYRPITDILGDAYPAVLKVCIAFDGDVWTNKEKFTTFLRKVREASPGKSGTFSKKQVAAKPYADAIWFSLFPAAPAAPIEMVTEVAPV